MFLCKLALFHTLASCQTISAAYKMSASPSVCPPLVKLNLIALVFLSSKTRRRITPRNNHPTAQSLFVMACRVGPCDRPWFHFLIRCPPVSAGFRCPGRVGAFRWRNTHHAHHAHHAPIRLRPFRLAQDPQPRERPIGSACPTASASWAWDVVGPMMSHHVWCTDLWPGRIRC